MQKHIYGLAATFDHFVGEEKSGIAEFVRVNSNNVRYGKSVALTVNHNPKHTITTTKNGEKTGELLLVQTGFGLYFRFTPITEDGMRAYRHVKQRKLRQCSCIFKTGRKKRDLEHEERLKRSAPGVLGTDRIYKYSDATIFEICLTSSPKDTETFCTTDPNHPGLKGVEWLQNIEHSDVEYWDDYVISKEIDEGIGEIEQRLERMDKLLNELRKKHDELEVN